MTPAQVERLPYRPCVGAMLVNARGDVFAGERIDTPGAWQMPQGGVDPGESPEAAALRELAEETGVGAGAARILGATDGWIPYDLPVELVPKLWGGRYRGQKQKWFALSFTGADEIIDIGGPHAEFSAWAWMTPQALLTRIVPFKRPTYERVFAELGGHL